MHYSNCTVGDQTLLDQHAAAQSKGHTQSIRYVVLCIDFALETLSSTGDLKYLILECMVCSIHSPPFLNAFFLLPNGTELIPYSLDIILTIGCITRIYLSWRIFIQGSFWADESAEKICREVCNTSGGPLFAFKCEMKERPY